MLLATPDLETHHLYPCVKLADFGRHSTSLNRSDTYRIGLAHTIGFNIAEIRYYKSAGPSVGTQGYVYNGTNILSIADSRQICATSECLA